MYIHASDVQTFTYVHTHTSVVSRWVHPLMEARIQSSTQKPKHRAHVCQGQASTFLLYLHNWMHAAHVFRSQASTLFTTTQGRRIRLLECACPQVSPKHTLFALNPKTFPMDCGHSLTKALDHGLGPKILFSEPPNLKP